MASYVRATRVAAPFEEVWDFHATIKGLTVLTPDWMGLEIEAIEGGDPQTEELEIGSRIRASVRPFGVGPRQRWISEITARERAEEYGNFRDIMTDGPFDHWEHTHHFVAESDETLVVDAIRYELPFGPIGRAFAPLAVVGFEPMFRYRHWTTRKLLG